MRAFAHAEGLHVPVARRREVGKRQIPARVVRHGGGVVEGVRARQDRLGERSAFAPAQAPALLEPGDVPDLPLRRIDDVELRPEQSLALEVARHQLGADLVAILDGRDRSRANGWIVHRLPQPGRCEGQGRNHADGEPHAIGIEHRVLPSK